METYFNCFQSYTTENKLTKHKKVCENHDYCHVKIPEQDNEILKYNQGEKSMKVPFIIYGDLESLLEKINTCHNDPEKSSTTKINKHTPSCYSLFTHCSFDTTKSKLDYYREIPVVFHNGSTYDYHFIIKALAEEFEEKFECLSENTEK